MGKQVVEDKRKSACMRHASCAPAPTYFEAAMSAALASALYNLYIICVAKSNKIKKKMYSAKQKVGDAGAVAKEHAEIFKAKAQEKAEKGMARSKEEKEIIHERRKAKEAEAKMKMHEAKAEHAQEKLYGKQHHHQGVVHPPVGAAAPPVGAVAPAYPLGGHPPGWVAPK